MRLVTRAPRALAIAAASASSRRRLRSGDPYRRYRQTQFDDDFRQVRKHRSLWSPSARADLLERALGFVARSIFWLGLVYSSMPFDSGSGRRPGSGGGDWPGDVAQPGRGLRTRPSEDCRSAVERLRLAMDVAAASVRAGDAFPQGGDDIPFGLRAGRKTRLLRRGVLWSCPPTAGNLWSLPRRTIYVVRSDAFVAKPAVTAARFLRLLESIRDDFALLDEWRSLSLRDRTWSPPRALERGGA